MSATPTSTVASSGSSQGPLEAGDTGVVGCPGIMQHQKGTDSSASAPVLTALGAVSGTAIQLSDLTRDYQVYLEVTTAGTATSLTIGPTSSASAVSLMTSQAATAGQVITFRLPAGWYFKWTGTTTAVGNQVAVGC